MVKLYRSAVWVFRLCCFCKRLQIQYAVDSLQGIVHDHGVFALEHDTGKGDGDDGRDDDIEHQIQQEILRNAAPWVKISAPAISAANTPLMAAV